MTCQLEALTGKPFTASSHRYDREGCGVGKSGSQDRVEEAGLHDRVL